MLKANVYGEIKNWKKPLHKIRANSAKAYLNLLPNIQIIGITGSVGKTLTQNAIDAVLSQKFKTRKGNDNLDPTFRIPKTLLEAKPWDQKLILEYGVEHPLDMDYYLKIVKPDIAVVLSVSPTHTKYFGGQEGVYNEKVKLVKALSKSDVAILNADDPNVARMANETNAKVKWFGENAKDSVKISHYTQSLQGAKFRLHFQGQKATVSWKILGKHQLTSAYAAAAVGIQTGVTLKQIAKGLSQAKPPEHRLNSVFTKGVKIIDDTYNSSPLAAGKSIETLVEVAKGKPKIAVLGEMKDLGTISKSAHEELGRQIAKTTINYLFTIGKVADEIGVAAKAAGFGGKIISVQTTKEAIEKIKEVTTPRTVILVKGSRHAHLERIVKGLLRQSTKINCYHCGTLS
ncbi:MAG: Mur ligase family protein [Candidatus Curtissbacteria bacterium]|nr:Mur ligase family protein [Candidatus Curtissbacteria bacterium]